MPPCCHIPSQPKGTFPASFETDAKAFSFYIGGGGMAAHALNPKNEITSALHFEMKIWKPTIFRHPYIANDIIGNSWKAMLAAWTNKSKGDTFTPEEKDTLISDICALPWRGDSHSCVLIQYDKWILNLIDHFRSMGLNPTRIPSATHPVTALGSAGLCQKLINLFVKYELCWQVAGVYQKHTKRYDHYSDLKILLLRKHLCALHAPVDNILLCEFKNTPIGQELAQHKQLVQAAKPTANNPYPTTKIKQSLDGQLKPWTELDCPRTYYGLQLIFRRIAMSTWPPGCACSKIESEAIRKCADWFNEAHPPCNTDNPDWLNIACELDEGLIRDTLTDNEMSHNTGTNIPQVKSEEIGAPIAESSSSELASNISSSPKKRRISKTISSEDIRGMYEVALKDEDARREADGRKKS